MESNFKDIYANTIFSSNNCLNGEDNAKNMDSNHKEEEPTYINYTDSNHSRQDSLSSSSSFSPATDTATRYNTTDRLDQLSDGTSLEDNSSLVLSGGQQLLEESWTEKNSSAAKENNLKDLIQNNVPVPAQSTRSGPIPSGLMSLSNGTGTVKARVAKSPFTSPPLESIPVEAVTIPADANISAFTCDQVANFLQCLRVEDRIISHLHRKQVDGKRFSRLKDSELESLGMMKNPVVVFFRDKSNVRAVKKKNHFIL